MLAICFADILPLNVYGCGHVNVKTTGTRPPATTALALLCKEKFKTAGCSEENYVDLIDHLIWRGAHRIRFFCFVSAVHDHLLQEDGDVNMADLAFLLLVLVSEIIITYALRASAPRVVCAFF